MLLVQPEALLGLLIERVAQEPVEDDDEAAHYGDAQHPMRWKSPAAVALAIQAPTPCASSFVSPQLTASATMLALSDPPEAVIAPVR